MHVVGRATGGHFRHMAVGAAAETESALRRVRMMRMSGNDLGNGLRVSGQVGDLFLAQGLERAKAGVTGETERIVVDADIYFELGTTGALRDEHRADLGGRGSVRVMTIDAGHFVEFEFPFG